MGKAKHETTRMLLRYLSGYVGAGGHAGGHAA